MKKYLLLRAVAMFSACFGITTSVLIPNIFSQSYYGSPSNYSSPAISPYASPQNYSSPMYGTQNNYGRYSRYAPFSDEGVRANTLQSSSELGLRYLKLGNSHREAGNSDLAMQYVRQGYELLRSTNSRYWQAVANEYMGMIYRDAGDRGTAMQYFQSAQSLYRTVMSPLRAESSLDAVGKILSDVEYSRWYFPRSENYAATRSNADRTYLNSYVDSYPPNSNYSFSSSSNFYPNSYYNSSTYPLSNSLTWRQQIEKERLQNANYYLQMRVSDLENRIRLLEQPVYQGR